MVANCCVGAVRGRCCIGVGASLQYSFVCYNDELGLNLLAISE